MNELAAWRAEARAWLESMVPTYGKEARAGLSVEDDLAVGRRYLAARHDAGYAGINWSPEVGGRGLSNLHKISFEAEEMRLGMPVGYFGISLGMPVPVLIHYCQDREFVRERVRRALRGEEIWCQLFSEPSGGSDLAALRSRVTFDGKDEWTLTGQKIWTSWAQYCDYGVIVARSDPTVAKHRGLTYFWVNMKAPGVTVRPIRLMGGGSHVNEVFFDEVKLGDHQRLGEVGGGFGVALRTLMIERYVATDSAGFGPHLDAFVSLAQEVEYDGAPAIRDGRIRSAIARNHAMRAGLDSITRRAQLMMQAGMQPGPEGSLQKLVAVRSRQKLSELALDLQGPGAFAFDAHASPREDWGTSWLNAPTGRIAGGSDEVLLNTIAEKILGLPQDHRPDKGVPFNELPA